MPILGIIASSFRSAAGPVGAYDALASVTVPSGGLTSITFAGIPTGYKHLQIRVFARSDKATENNDALAIRFNGDSASNYRSHTLQADGSGVYAGSGSHTYSFMNYVAGDAGTANVFGGAIIDVLDYTSSVKNKTIRGLGGNDRNGSGLIDFTSSLWFKTPEAITSIEIFPQSFSTFKWKQYSSFALYGIK
jgi:hypothetical protein